MKTKILLKKINIILTCVLLSYLSHSQIKLNQELSTYTDIIDFKITPDNNKVIYLYKNVYTSILYSVPINGGPKKELNPSILSGGEIKDFKLAPDGNTIVYLADQDIYEKFELYTVDINGGNSTKISGSMPDNTDVFIWFDSFIISPDGNTVVFLADMDLDDYQEVYSVPIVGGTLTKLSQTNDQVHFRTVKISPNSNFVLYVSDSELFSVPINGGIPVKLNAPRQDVGGQVSSNYDISSDSNFVLYKHQFYGDDSVNSSVYITPITGGNKTNISGTGYSTGAWRFTPDNQVIYFTGTIYESEGSFYSVDQNGVDNLKLINSTPINTVFEFEITPNGNHIIFKGADENYDNYIYSLQMSGGTHTQISDKFRSGSFKLSPNGNSVLFLADREVDIVLELYEVPTSGGAIKKINGELVSGGNIDDHPSSYGRSIYNYSNNEENIVYLADQDTDNVFELYSFSTSTIWSSNLNNPTNFTTIDSDTDTFNWTIEGVTSGKNTANKGFAGSGSRFFSQSWDTTAGNLNPDNLLITPTGEISIPASATSISFKLNVEASNSSRPAENFAIYVFDEAVGQSFNTKIYEETLTVGGAGTDKDIIASIPTSFAEKNVGIIVRHYNCTGQDKLYVDDFEVSYEASALSTNDNFTQNIVLYPNPTKSIISINIKEDVHFILTNVNGQVLNKGILSQDKNIVNMSQLPKGLYFISLKNEQLKVTKKIIKQ
tara:strand:+ start:2566 stop:4719 length:2154 start_codon:yes stop_codon:yes gene_type:complete